jgi:hypothetical protein
MHTVKNFLPLLLIVVASCAKEIYTNEDATNAKREAQKVGLTVMIRDINNPNGDTGGFTVSASQCGQDADGVTSADGIANLMLVKGDAVLRITKSGYMTVTAVVTTAETEKERNNTAVIIPVFADTQTKGAMKGDVSVKISPTVEEPLVGALVSIEIDVNELIHTAFPAVNGNIYRYLPGILSWTTENLMQPVRTGVSGSFQLTIPATVADLAYTVHVHETSLTSHSSRTVMTNGQNNHTVHIQLTPSEE